MRWQTGFACRVSDMEIEFQKAVGKSAGEVIRDIAEFLEYDCVIHPEKQINLRTLLPDLNMAEQFSFALLAEAMTQGWDPATTESFYRRAVAPLIPAQSAQAMLEAFRDLDSEAFLIYRKKYGNRFTMLDGSYWSSCLALGIDAGQVGDVMRYLRLFTVCLMEVAFMGDRNPNSTFTWTYYESFRKMLDDLTAEPEPEPQPLKIRALGGSAGKRNGDSYALSLGVDIENPNPDRMAREISIDITLKDRGGKVIAVIRDQIQSIDPATIYHYGVTRKITGAAVAGISATAKASSHLKLSTPIMKHAKLSAIKLTRAEGSVCLSGTLQSEYDKPIHSLVLHCQLLSADNKILGGANEWLFDGILAGGSCPAQIRIPVSIPSAAKILYSVDFDAMELVKD